MHVLTVQPDPAKDLWRIVALAETPAGLRSAARAYGPGSVRRECSDDDARKLVASRVAVRAAFFAPNEAPSS